MGGGDGGDRDDWGADTQDVMLSVQFQDGARQETSSDSKGSLTSWRCLRTLTCLEKEEERNTRMVSINIVTQVSHFIVQGAKGALHSTEKAAVLGKLFVLGLAFTLRAA